MKPVEKVLGRMEGVLEPNGSWKALCLAYDDQEPSLSVSEGDDGRTLIKCFAGCEAIEIVAELSLEMGDFLERRNGHRKTLTLLPENDTVGGKDIPRSCSTEGQQFFSHTRKGGAGWVLSIDPEQKAVVVQKRRRTTK
jgi:hypothetical protein